MPLVEQLTQILKNQQLTPLALTAVEETMKAELSQVSQPLSQLTTAQTEQKYSLTKQIEEIQALFTKLQSGEVQPSEVSAAVQLALQQQLQQVQTQQQTTQQLNELLS